MINIKLLYNFNPLRYYRNLPKNTKKFLTIFVLPLKIPYNAWGEMQFKVYILSAKGRNCEHVLKTLYITSCKIVPYFTERIYESTPDSIYIKKVFLWQLKRTIKEQSPDIDLIIIDVHKFIRYFFKLKNAFLIPVWIKQTLDINLPIDKIINNFRKNTKLTDLRKIRKFKYSYDVFSDLGSLNFFYEKMHMPYIQKRYTSQAETEDLEELKIFLKKSEILFIKENGKYIAGSLCKKKNDTYLWHAIGILDGNEEFVKRGALGALYYFAIHRAKEEKMKTIEFGRSRPFLSDGVLHYKRKWGARVCQDKNLNRFIYLILNKPQKVTNVFNDQPFICVDKGKLKAVVFLNDANQKSDFDINNFLEGFDTPGIISFKVIDLEGEKEYVPRQTWINAC